MTTPKEILLEPGPLDDDECETMRTHTIDGQRMLDGLRTEAIALPARVVAVAHAYSAMTTRRTYREPMTPVIATRELHVHAGQFDPVVVAAALVGLARDAPIEIPKTKRPDHA